MSNNNLAPNGFDFVQESNGINEYNLNLEKNNISKIEVNPPGNLIEKNYLSYISIIYK